MSERLDQPKANQIPDGVKPTVNLVDLSLGSETPPPQASLAKPEFPNVGVHRGSYYHKVVSDYGSWTGIDAVVTLGAPQVDATRKNQHGKYLDAFSTYLGGRAKGGRELDAGLTWDVTLKKDGTKDFSHNAWRPFWRNGTWHNAPAEPKYYWRPGDTVEMSLHMVAPGKLKLTISDVSPNPKRSFSTEIKASGFTTGQPATFKRVDSIDQVGNEGKTVKPTQAALRGINWLTIDLLTDNVSGPGHVPFDATHQKVINDPAGHVRVQANPDQDASGGEKIEIDGRKIP